MTGLQPLVLNSSHSKNHTRSIWILSKDGCSQDVYSSFANHSIFNVYGVSRRYFKSLASKYLPPDLDDNSYNLHSSPRLRDLKRQYYNALLSFFTSFNSKYLPSAIISGNFGYYAEREVASVCKELRIPFIVLHKECFKPQGRLDFFYHVYKRRGPSLASLILVYNNSEKSLQIKSQVASSNNVYVVGMPRMDYLHKQRICSSEQNVESSPHLVAFGFSPYTGLPRIPRKKSGSQVTFEYLDSDHLNLSWHKLLDSYLDTLYTIAVEHSHLPVTLKLKRSTKDSFYILNYFSCLDLPPNFCLTSSIDSQQLISKATCVTGFNSTTLLEAIAYGLPVVVPIYHESAEEKYHPYIPNLSSSTHYSYSSSEFKNNLLKLSAKSFCPPRYLSSNSLDDLGKWCGNIDGKSGQRAHQVILNHITTFYD